MNLSFLLGILPTFIFGGLAQATARPSGSSLPLFGPAARGTRGYPLWKSMGGNWMKDFIPRNCSNVLVFFWRCQFCLGYSAIHNSIGGTTQKRRSHGQTRRYTFSSALPFVAYETTKSMRALGSWVLVLKMEKRKYCNFRVLTPKLGPIIIHVFYHYHYIFQVGHKSVTLMLDGLLFL